MNIEQLKKDLIRDEGFRSKPYKCTAGKLTIGVGRNIEDNGITEDEAMYLLNNDINNCILQLTKKFPWFNSKPDNVKRVLINMCFNLGISRLSSFKTTLKLIEIGDYKEASVQMLKSLWARQVGQRAVRLSSILKNEV